MDLFGSPIVNVMLALTFFITGTKLVVDEIRDFNENQAQSDENNQSLKVLLTAPMTIPGLILVITGLLFLVHAFYLTV